MLLTIDEVPKDQEGILLNVSGTTSEEQIRLNLGHLLEHRVNDVSHHLTSLVLLADLGVVDVTPTSVAQAGSVELVKEAVAPEGKAIRVDSVVGGVADEAEVANVLVVFDAAGDVLVELCKKCQYNWKCKVVAVSRAMQKRRATASSHGRVWRLTDGEKVEGVGGRGLIGRNHGGHCGWSVW